MSQQELGRRVGRPQSTIARWERGTMTPSVEALREAVRACGLELTMGIAKLDRSYQPLIEQQLRLAPAARLAALAPDGFHLQTAIRALHESGLKFVLIGAVAAVLQGSPVAPGRTIEVAPVDRAPNMRRFARALETLGCERIERRNDHAGLHARLIGRAPAIGGSVAAVVQPAGTAGYGDLRRDAICLEIGGGLEVAVAPIADLLRIAHASPRPEDRSHISALQATLERVEMSSPSAVSRDPLAAWKAGVA